MPLPENIGAIDLGNFHKTLVEAITTSPLSSSTDGRRALLIQAGLSTEQLSRVPLEGATAISIPLQIEYLTEESLRVNFSPDYLAQYIGVVSNYSGVEQKVTLKSQLEVWENIKRSKPPMGLDLCHFMSVQISSWAAMRSPLLPRDMLLSELVRRPRVMHGQAISGSAGAIEQLSSRTNATRGVGAIFIEDLLLGTEHGRYHIVYGDPGSGKTTLFLNEAAHLCEKCLNGNGSLIPIFVRLSDFARFLGEKGVLDVLSGRLHLC